MSKPARLPSIKDWIAKVRARKAASGSSLDVKQILEYRDADRR
jgi:hypothetical protein